MCPSTDMYILCNNNLLTEQGKRLCMYIYIYIYQQRTMDIIGLYPNIPHGKGPASLRKLLESTNNKQISSDTLTELVEVVLNNNIFEFDEKTFKQKVFSFHGGF